MKKLRNPMKCLLLVFLYWASIPSVLAQGSEGSATVLEEIIVTSQRRTESLQEVPAAVTAIRSEQLEIKQISDVLDLQYAVPNISLATNTGTANGARIFLRGVGEDESRVSADPAVGVYVDGVYVGRQVGALFDLVDLERVEVLRGPQGTLYGRNSNGGAIKLVGKAPSTEANSYNLAATLGSDGRMDIKATANWALSENTALRASILDKRRDGFHTLNPNGDFANLAGTEVGELDTSAFRASLWHNFNDDWSVNVILDVTNDDSDPIPDSAAAGNDVDNNLFTIEPLAADSPCSASTPATAQGIGCFSNYSSEVDSKGLSATFTGDLDGHQFKSITGYREMQDDLFSRIGFPYEQHTDQEQFSQEFTLTSELDGPLNYVAGLFTFMENVVLDSVFIFPHRLDIETGALALFLHGSYDFSPSLTLTAGVRYTDESKDLSAAGPGNPDLNDSISESKTQYTLSLQNQFTENVMGYVSYSTGFKSGGWSPDCFSPTACFRPVASEELDSFEMGLRSDLVNDRLRLNGTYFFNRYEGLQIGATVPGLGFTRFNTDQVQINGLELEMIFIATESLSFTATLGTLDGNYDSLTLQQAGGLTNNGESAGCNGVASIDCALGLKLKNAPDYKGTLGAAYDLAMGSGVLTLGIDVSFEDQSYSLVANSPAHALTDPGTLVDARLGWQSNNNWRLVLWGKNLGDKAYARAATARAFSQYAADPMTWGVDFGIAF